jgi:hypothetical protein
VELTPELEEKLFQCFSNKLWRLNNLYKIKDKNGHEIDFRLNPAQEHFFKNKHNKNVILKARQQGFTTLQCISFLDDCLFKRNLAAGIIAHNVEDAEDFFESKIKFAYDKLDPSIKNTIRAEQDSAGKLKFSNGSTIRVRTSFRSGTLQRLHISEFGKIAAEYPKKAKEIRTGAFNAVSLDQEITVESTAEGMSGEFFNLCEKAQVIDPEQLTPLDFKFFFFAWWQSRDYRLNPVGITIPDSMEAYFDMLQKEHKIKLDDYQRAWYFKKSEEQGEEMHQEYPSHPEEAFMASGRPVFNRDKIASDIKTAKSASFKRLFVTETGVKEVLKGGVIVYKTPQENAAYSIGADIAEGLEDGDYSTACVLDKNFEQVAVYKGHIDPDLFGRFLVYLGRYYNNAVLTPEVNNHGHATLAAIKNERYYQIYRREVQEDLSSDVMDKVGWLNNVKSKMKMLDDFKQAYRDGSLRLNHEETLREMRTLTLEEDGNVILNGKDLVVAAGLAIQGLGQAVSPGRLGTHESSGDKTRFRSLEEMLKHSQEKEESYFD